MSTDTNLSLESITRDTEERIERMERELQLLQHTLIGKGWVVRMPGHLYLSLEVSDEKNADGGYDVIGSEVTISPVEASWLTERDARSIADNVRNGAGERGEAVHIKDALATALERDRECLAMFRQVSQDR